LFQCLELNQTNWSDLVLDYLFCLLIKELQQLMRCLCSLLRFYSFGLCKVHDLVLSVTRLTQAKASLVLANVQAIGGLVMSAAIAGIINGLVEEMFGIHALQ
jgi:hypothetical protein